MKHSLLAVRVAITAALVLLLALPAQTAHADSPGITSSLLLNGQTYQGTDVVDEGDVLTLRVQYNTDVPPGSTVVFDIGSHVDVTGVPATSTAIESVTQDGNKVSVTFKDPWPAGVNQGVFDLKLTVDKVESSASEKITWKVDGDESSVDVIIRNKGDEFANVKDGYAKSATPGNLDAFVTVVDGKVKLKPQIVDQELSYTLRVDSPQARNGFVIADQLPAGLDYVSGSFGGQLTSWDADGLNRTTAPFTFAPTVAGDSFTSSVNLPGPSVLAITYKAKVTDVAAIEALLQSKYDALGGGTGSFEIQLTNTASFGGTDKKAPVRLRGTVPGVNVGSAFGKTADWSTKNVVTDEDGNLTPPADITYTLKADLRQWTGGPNFTLDRNVVISDVLPSQASWRTGADDFVTASGITLTQATSCPADAAAFSGDSFVGQFCVDGQRLLVNVGKDNTTNATIAVKAQLNTVDGLTKAGSTSIEDATPYRWRNVADFHYRAGNPHSATRDVTVVVLPGSSEGINDSSVFKKNGAATDATIAPGESVTVDYTFSVAAGKGIDARTSKIVDYVDAGVFDVSDLDAMAVSGTYDGQALTASHFALSSDPDGNLVIELSDAGRAIVDARGADKKYDVKLSLTSKPFEGKETKSIKNKATLFGEDDNPLYWSRTETSATSYGDEAEVRKRVYDRSSKDWVETVKARMDGSGNLVQDTYVYRIEFIPHGSYDNVVIVPVRDVLPDAVDFLGFVNEGDAAEAGDPSVGPVEIGGNLIASYDAAEDTVTIRQKDGTRLDAGSPIAAYVAVKVTDAADPIVNKIGDTSAEIVPVKSVSVGDYVWVDTDRDGRQDDDERGIPGVTLTIVGPDGEPVTDVSGKPVGPVTTDSNGKYTFDNLPALSGAQTYTVRIDKEASAEALRPYVPTTPGEGDRAGDSSTWEASTVPGDLTEDGDRDPTLDFGFVTKTYAIGDFVWIDTDRDGIQDEGEKPLADVAVELLDEDGNVVDSTTTDDKGRYAFDDLRAGTYRVRFTLTEEQAAVYQLTGLDRGADDAVDSDANPANGMTATIVLDDSNQALTGDYEFGDIKATEGIDPTWDAGVNLKSVSVGDYVWVDSNRDGRQDDNEPGIPGVVLTIVGPDGEPVTDVYGDVVKPVTTDRDGKYTFANLPALPGDGTYTVRIDREESTGALKPYVPTKAAQGDRAGDSSTWEASTEPGDLTEDGDRDPTLDFGFVAKTYAIGDYVWIDADNDGVQDRGEKALPGVKVELFAEDGKVLATSRTDKHGRYVFDNLLAGTYRIGFTLTDRQKKEYAFTVRDAGRSDARDSDANRSDGLTRTVVLDDSNQALTSDYEHGQVGATQGIDPTWDAGVVVKRTSPGAGGGDDKPDTSPRDGDNGFLPNTGATVGLGVLAAALALLGLGAVLVGLGRRKRLSSTSI